MSKKFIYHINTGKADYKEIWDLQKRIHLFKQQNNFPDVLISTEHNNVFTLGKSGDRDHLLLNEQQLGEQDISYYEIDRGGDLTYHGPGQLVCYPIFDLNNYYKDTHKFLRDLEEVIILTLKEYGIEAGRDEDFTGVWVGEEKICAIGIKVSRWITMHGLAFNINSDLSYFDKIIPCGIFHKGVTSMKKLIGEVSFEEVKNKVVNNFVNVFGAEVNEISIEDLEKMIAEDKVVL